MNKRKCFALLIALYLITINLISIIRNEAWTSKVQASSFFVDNKTPKLVLLMVDYIELEDMAGDPYLSWIADHSTAAWISNRQNGKNSLAKAKLAMGTGHKLEIDGNMQAAADVQDRLDSLTNLKINELAGNICYQNIKKLRKLNEKSEFGQYIGYVGEQLNSLNQKTCFIGNSDAETQNRSAMLLLMDRGGFVDNGEVEEVLTYDPDFPGERRTDYNRLFELYRMYEASSNFIAIDTGDLTRLEYYKGKMDLDNYDSLRKTTINKISALFNKLVAKSSKDTVFVLLSAYASKTDQKDGFKLAPIFVYNYKDKGFLYSGSSKREGIITGTDLPDLWMQLLGNSDSSKVMRVEKDNVLQQMDTMKSRLLNTSLMRLPVLTWYAIFEIICAIAGFLYMFGTNNKDNLLLRSLKIIMLSNIVAPAVLLYMASFTISGPGMFYGLFILHSLLAAVLIYLSFKSTIMEFFAAALFVNLSMGIDLLRGGQLIKNSVFGYDPIIGARFYGIGNEFAGVFIGSGILLIGCLLQFFSELLKKKKMRVKALILLFIGCQLALIGIPTLGANFGGTIAAVCGYFFFFHSANESKLSWKHLLSLGVALPVVLALIIALDMLNTTDSTHIGKFVMDIKDNGIHVLISTMERKAAMNLRLIKYTIWTKVLLCIILIITIMFFKPVRLLHGIFKKYKYLASAWLGISAGSITGLIVNDSGIVMAATAMIFTGYTILYLCLEERTTYNE